jgi:hypothetical protein
MPTFGKGNLGAKGHLRRSQDALARWKMPVNFDGHLGCERAPWGRAAALSGGRKPTPAPAGGGVGKSLSPFRFQTGGAQKNAKNQINVLKCLIWLLQIDHLTTSICKNAKFWPHRSVNSHLSRDFDTPRGKGASDLPRLSISGPVGIVHTQRDQNLGWGVSGKARVRTDRRGSSAVFDRAFSSASP